MVTRASNRTCVGSSIKQNSSSGGRYRHQSKTHDALIFSGTSIHEFCTKLPPDSSVTVVNILKEIARLRQQMVVNVLAIGQHLAELRTELKSDQFSHFMRTILPSFGISRSTGYRWIGLAEKLALTFPNPLIQKQLMAHSDGRGIVPSQAKQGKGASPDIVLTPAAHAALQTLPPVPKPQDGVLKSEQWVSQFLKATGKARAQVRILGRNKMKHQEQIIHSFKRFARLYGPEAAEDICGQLDKVLNSIVEREHSVGKTSFLASKIEVASAIRHSANGVAPASAS